MLVNAHGLDGLPDLQHSIPPTPVWQTIMDRLGYAGQDLLSTSSTLLEVVFTLPCHHV
jgi:hypothetical protein